MGGEKGQLTLTDRGWAHASLLLTLTNVCA